MATVHTVVTPKAYLTSLTGGTDAERLRAGAARGIVTYFDSTASNWPASGAGNNRSISFSITLDPDYAYVMTDASCSFIALNTSSIGMEAVGMMEFKIPTRTGDEYAYSQYVCEAARQDTSGSTAIGSVNAQNYNSQYPILDTSSPASMTFQVQHVPQYILFPYEGTNDEVKVNSIFSESESNEPALTCRFSARFVQYDISQAYDWRMQSPVDTR